MRRPTGAEARAAAWTLRAIVSCRRQLASATVAEVDLPSAAHLPATAEPAVPAVLRLLRRQCLTSALVLQAWRADHGEALDVVIGVTAPSAGFTAHAWLDDSAALSRGGDGFEPLHRVPPRRSAPQRPPDRSSPERR